MTQPVILKSNPHGINLILDPDCSFSDLLADLARKLHDSDKFFRNARIALSFEGRELNQEEQLQIMDVITDNSSIEIVCVLDRDEQAAAYCADKIRAFDDEQAGRSGQFYKGTLRNGQVLECETSLIILGDVNPGAKVVAKGNIVILGSLKGNAYAGAAGNPHAFVAALDMDPVQIKIGNVIGRSSDCGPLSAIKNRKRSMEPQVAVVEDDSILIEPITKGWLNNI